MTIDDIAKVCHESNRAWCECLGDRSQPRWEEAPQWQRDSAVDGVRFHLENPLALVDESHNRWIAHKVSEGWIYGETKDPEKKTHPCMVPFSDLPMGQQAKDYLFRSIVHALSHFIVRDER